MDKTTLGGELMFQQQGLCAIKRYNIIGIKHEKKENSH
jgi:hypothetical protein